MASLTMILLAALLCNYGRGFCLIDVGTEGSGTVQTQYTFDPFGATTASGASSNNVFQFTGRENDGTGLYYDRAVYYNPAISRFISEDPIFPMSGVNSYAYALDNPLLFNDPFWLSSRGDLAFQGGASVIGGILGMGAAIALLPESGPAAALVAYGMWRSWVETTSGMTKLMASYGDVCVGEKVDQTQTLTSVSGLITYRETGSFEAAEFATRWDDLGLIVTGKALSFKAEFEPFERGDEAFENLTMMTTTSELMTYNPGSNDPKCDKLGLRLMPLRIQSPDVMMINAKAGALTIVLYLPFFSGSPRSWRAGTLIKSARRHCGFFLDTMP